MTDFTITDLVIGTGKTAERGVDYCPLHRQGRGHLPE